MSRNAQGPTYKKNHHTETFLKAYQLGDASGVFALGNTGESVRYTVKKNGKGGRIQSICPCPDDAPIQNTGGPPTDQPDSKDRSLAYNGQTKDAWLKDGWETYKAQYGKLVDFKNRKLFLFAQALNEVHERFSTATDNRTLADLPSSIAIPLAEFWVDQCLAPIQGPETEHAQSVLNAVDAEAKRLDPQSRFNNLPKRGDALRLFQKIRSHLTKTTAEGWRPLPAGDFGRDGAERTVGAYINVAGNESKRSERFWDFQKGLHYIMTLPESLNIDWDATSKAAVGVCEARGDKEKIAEVVRVAAAVAKAADEAEAADGAST